MSTLGKLIVIDGTDGSGKATQTELLFQRLEALGVKVKKIDFPQYTQNFFGQLVRECLDGKHGDFLAIPPKIASVLYSADRWESSPTIRQWLDEGYVVISDRYVSANQIHQGGKIKNDEDRKDFLSWLNEMEFEIFQIPKPDLIVYLHVPVEISTELLVARARQTNIPQDQAESDARHLLASQESALKIIEERNNWVKIDCASGGEMRPREKIHDDVFDKIKGLL